MKMAKASQRDLDGAIELYQFLQAMADGRPASDAVDEFGYEGYGDLIDRQANDAEFLLRAHERGGLFRVVWGMQVLLDPANEVVDPNLPHLELHPKHGLAAREREELCKAKNEAIDERDAARAEAAKAKEEAAREAREAAGYQKIAKEVANAEQPGLLVLLVDQHGSEVRIFGPDRDAEERFGETVARWWKLLQVTSDGIELEERTKERDAANAQRDDLLSKLETWCRTGGRHYVPTPGSSDSFGDGVRQAQREVQAMVSVAITRAQSAKPAQEENDADGDDCPPCDHVVTRAAGNNTMPIECLHCGASITLALPVSVDEMAATTHGFVERHRACAKPAGGAP